MGWDVNDPTMLTAPIDFADIAVAAGQSTLPYNLGTMIENGAFNIWSKNKPVRCINPGIISASQRLDALYGMNIPSLGTVDFLSRYSEQWGYNKPRGRVVNGVVLNEWFRSMDFDGYRRNVWWPIGSGSTYLYTIFNGSLNVQGSTVAAGSRVYFNMQCKENPESDELGLLYPADFVGAVSPYDLSLYYIGLAIIDFTNNQTPNTAYFITGDRMDAHFGQGSVYNYYTGIDTEIPSGLNPGQIEVVPILASNQVNTPGVWQQGLSGSIVTLNGAHLGLTLMSGANNVNTTVSFEQISGGMRINFTIENVSGSLMTIRLWGYLMSAGSREKECDDSSFTAPEFYHGLGPFEYISQHWPNSDQSRPDIMYSTLTGTAQSPDYLAAVSCNVDAAFVNANGGSRSLSPSSPGAPRVVSFYVDVNGTSDGWGSYYYGSSFALCLTAGALSEVREEIQYFQ